MKLLLIVSNRIGRGTYWRALGFGQELVKRGHLVTLLVVASRRMGVTEQQMDGVRIVETPDLLPASGYDGWDTINRIWWLKDHSFDLIHAFESRPVTIFPALYAQRRQHIPLILDWCDWFGRGGSVEERPNPVIRWFLRPIETFFEEKFRPFATGTTVINQVLHQKAVALGVSPETILHLPNGANIDDIHPKLQKDAREKLGLPVESLILGYTGAMFQSDGRLMADAFERVYKANSQTRLLLIGYSTMQIERWLDKAKGAVLRSGMVSREDLADYVAACDMGWLTLKNNGANQGRFPMKLYDFMAAQRPVVVTDVADLGAMVKQRGIGVVSADEAQTLADATLDLWLDKEKIREMGQAGRRVLEAEFATPIITNSLERFYTRWFGK